MYHIAFALLGGGTGKSTSAVNVGHALAMQGLRTLIVDADRQGQCAVFLGRNPEPGIHQWLGGNLMGLKEPLENIVRQTGRGQLDLLPGSQQTEMLQRMLVAFDSPPRWLKDQLEADREFFAHYDVVVWDTAPTGRLLDMVLHLADIAVLPVPADLKGQSSLADTLAILPASTERIVLPTRVPTAQRVSTDFLRGYQVDYPGTMYTDDEGKALYVPERASVRTSQALGQTIFEYGPNSDVAEVYRRLAYYLGLRAYQAVRA